MACICIIFWWGEKFQGGNKAYSSSINQNSLRKYVNIPQIRLFLDCILKIHYVQNYVSHANFLLKTYQTCQIILTVMCNNCVILWHSETVCRFGKRRINVILEILTKKQWLCMNFKYFTIFFLLLISGTGRDWDILMGMEVLLTSLMSISAQIGELNPCRFLNTCWNIQLRY